MSYTFCKFKSFLSCWGIYLAILLNATVSVYYCVFTITYIFSVGTDTRRIYAWNFLLSF